MISCSKISLVDFPVDSSNRKVVECCAQRVKRFVGWIKSSV